MSKQLNKKDVKAIRKESIFYFKELRENGVSDWRAGKMAATLLAWMLSGLAKSK